MFRTLEVIRCPRCNSSEGKVASASNQDFLIIGCPNGHQSIYDNKRFDPRLKMHTHIQEVHYEPEDNDD